MSGVHWGAGQPLDTHLHALLYTHAYKLETEKAGKEERRVRKKR